MSNTRIKTTRDMFNQKVIVEYDELSDNNTLINKKKSIIQSLSILQLLISTLSNEQSSELTDILCILEETYIHVENVLFIKDSTNGIDKYK